MRQGRRRLALVLAASLAFSFGVSAQTEETFYEQTELMQTEEELATEEIAEEESAEEEQSEKALAVTSEEERAYIEETLNLANNEDQEWTYVASADAWVLSVVAAVAYPELPDQQGVSVCVPGAYVTGIDTDGDKVADVTAESYETAVKGSLVIDYEAEVVSSNGQVYTAATAPVILNTGAAGYGSSSNSTAATTYAAEGYINVACGNRGKQDTATDEDGNTYYTGDAPSCLADQKAAARYVKYNILLGNLPGNVDYFVSTGGSGGGAHAVMFAATSDHSDYYDYQIEAGAVGVYRNEDGSYSTTVTIDGVEYELSDGAWGCVAYSAITSLYEADMALAFEYYMDTTYAFGSSFQAQLAEYLSAAYMEYINAQELSVEESAVGFDLNGDGDFDDVIALTIEYDLEAYPETNGYYGTYLDLYLAEFTENLQWYLDNLDYAEGWTWFDEEGNALSDEEVAAMTSEERAQAFLEGRYAKGSSSSVGELGGAMTGLSDMASMGTLPDGGLSDLSGELAGGMSLTLGDELPEGEISALTGGVTSSGRGELTEDLMSDMSQALEEGLPEDEVGALSEALESDMSQILEEGLPETETEQSTNELLVGTPEAGSTQSATGSVDSANYSSYEEMVEAYRADIEEVLAGDEYGKNQVELYNPLNYIGAEDTTDPTWIRIVMGTSEGDISLFCSLNLQIAFLNAGVDAVIEWQWDGGHVPSEILGNSLALYVDQMYAAYVEGAASVEKEEAVAQTKNGSATEATGTDISAWVAAEDIESVSFTLAAAVAYRTKGASKAMPGFDVIDYGQEDYVFGSSEQDARHWNVFLLEIFETYAQVLAPLFNSGT